MIVIRAFNAGSNDWLYWEGKRYNCSESPLNAFIGYDSLYAPWFILCENSGLVRHEKNYMTVWEIKDNCLYLCDIIISCNDNTHPSIEDCIKGFSRKLTFNDAFLIKMIPIEELTNRKFQIEFPVGIYKYPLGSGYVIPADWFDGAIDIKEESPYYFAPYQRLTFKSGKLVSIQNLIYYDWESIKESIKKEKEKINKNRPPYLFSPE
ncbi:MAG: hypothetical protein LBV74_21565 [Tannerella sp.]|nr:hypothetical protein [Tannerella sp.]